jgi:eukaryotic-like serine/threonine-protein kinase
MGEVYLGRDTRLGRSVAIKILGVDVSNDPKLRARFEKEAKAISSLNHPNICALYDVGEVPMTDSTSARGRVSMPYIVMEYLEGETLEKRLKSGPLAINQALQYGVEIADALDKAHRKQILHRDLKPSNVMLTKRGARLFDFGLAKFLRKQVAGSSEELTLPVMSDGSTPEKSLTAEGTAVGTLEYMSPEQLQGKDPDARTDIFSLGVCLYQMIAGRRPFQGNSRATLVAAILDHEPVSVSHVRPDAPRSLDWLLKNCLAKDPDERIQTAHDVTLELKRIAEESRTGPQSQSRRRYEKRTVWASTVIAASVAIVAALVLTMRQGKWVPSSNASVKRFSISLPTNAPLAEGAFEKFAVSPDGTRVAYVGGKDPTKLYVYSVDTLENKPLPGTDGARGPFFSPTGEWVGFYTDEGELKKVALAGGQAVLLSTRGKLRGATWGPDNTIVFAEPPFPLQRLSASGSEVDPISSPDSQAQLRWPSFLPGGEHLLYTASGFRGDYESARLGVVSVKTGKAKVLLTGATYGRYVSPGFLVYLHSEAIYAVPFDLRELSVTGSPKSLVADVDSYFTTGLAHFGVSSDGSLFYIPRPHDEYERELIWVDRSGTSTPVTSVRRTYQQPKISPNGKGLLVTVGSPPRADIWSYDIARDTWSRLTSEGINDSPIWSPDGKLIAYASNKSGGFDLYLMPSDASSSSKRVTARRAWDFPSSWSADGKVILVSEQYRATLGDIFAVSPREGAIPAPVVSTRFDEGGGVFSPDAHWFAYRSSESGRSEIYVQPYPPTGRKWLVSLDGGSNPVWRRDGKELFYRNGNRMMSVSLDLGSEFNASKPRVLFRGDFEPDFDVTPDGQRFIMVKRPPQAQRTQINVVLGAFDHLK